MEPLVLMNYGSIFSRTGRTEAGCHLDLKKVYVRVTGHCCYDVRWENV